MSDVTEGSLSGFFQHQNIFLHDGNSNPQLLLDGRLGQLNPFQSGLERDRAALPYKLDVVFTRRGS